jgi:preprotein translocase subunit SecG
MEPVILVIHLFLALGIIVLVLLQRSEGGGLGMGGGGLGGLSTARGTANALTKATAIFAALFFITSLTLGVLAGGHSKSSQGVLEGMALTDVSAPGAPTPAAPDNAPLDIQVVPEEAGVLEPPAPEGSTVTAPAETPAEAAPKKPVAPVAQ